MADTLVPDHVDARKIFTKDAIISGTLPVEKLRRLTQSLSNGEGTVHADLHFTVDEERRRIVSGVVKAQVNAVCQRCLEAVTISLEDSLNLALVETEEHIRRLPADIDPWQCTDAQLNLPDIIEEQLILCMPLVSYHPAGECTGIAESIRAEHFSAGNQPASDSISAVSPFAMLKNLKNKQD
jgi:uncharacterized protein